MVAGSLRVQHVLRGAARRRFLPPRPRPDRARTRSSWRPSGRSRGPRPGGVRDPASARRRAGRRRSDASVAARDRQARREQPSSWCCASGDPMRAGPAALAGLDTGGAHRTRRDRDRARALPRRAPSGHARAVRARRDRRRECPRDRARARREPRHDLRADPAHTRALGRPPRDDRRGDRRAPARRARLALWRRTRARRPGGRA
jgi:hypothetical protein